MPSPYLPRYYGSVRSLLPCWRWKGCGSDLIGSGSAPVASVWVVPPGSNARPSGSS
jgi:hypothetical protein